MVTRRSQLGPGQVINEYMLQQASVASKMARFQDNLEALKKVLEKMQSHNNLLDYFKA